MNDKNLRTIIKRASARSPRSSGLVLLSGVLIGSALMYLLDPRQGVRRRSLARDKARSMASRTISRAGKAVRHVSNQLVGVVANMTQNLKPEGTVSDRKLADRVRATIGRSLQHPHKVDIAVNSGVVTMRGDLKPHEAGQLVLAIERVPGVANVDNQIIDTSLPQ